jgi:hypothetical protein
MRRLTGEKSVRSFPLDLGRLIRSFHGFTIPFLCRIRADVNYRAALSHVNPEFPVSNFPSIFERREIRGNITAAQNKRRKDREDRGLPDLSDYPPVDNLFPTAAFQSLP